MAGQAIAERELTLADFDFELPAELIAQHPLPDRAASRLLHVAARAPRRPHFGDMLELLDRDDLLVFNDTRVIKARLFGHKPSGGKVEVLVERVPEPTLALALVRTSHKPAPRQPVCLRCRRRSDGRRPARRLLRAALQPRRARGPRRAAATCRCRRTSRIADSAADAERYQTVYAARPGAVAAPTAGLHFTPDLLDCLHARGVAARHAHAARRRRHVPAGAQRATGRAPHAHGALRDLRRHRRRRQRGAPRRAARRRGRHDQPARARVGRARRRRRAGGRPRKPRSSSRRATGSASSTG